MYNEIITSCDTHLPDVRAGISVSATGNATAIGAVYGGISFNMNSPETIAVLREMFGGSRHSHALEWASLNTKRFNLFVLENENYQNGMFCIGKRVSLERYTDKEFKDFFKPLSQEAKDELKKMPCIFARKNIDFKKADNPQPAALGRITDIDCQGEQIRFCFELFRPFIEQQFINDHINDFGLKFATVRNQLDEEHWSIRAGNLLKIISGFGIVIE